MHSFKFFTIILIVITYVDCKINATYTNWNFANVNEHYDEKNFSAIINAIMSNDSYNKQCMDNLDRCMEKDDGYRSSTDLLYNFLITSLPPFDLSEIEGVNLQCRRQSEKYMKDLANFKLWALKMYDSNAKISSGLLNGNTNQFGDFDLCLAAKSNELNIKGKYCLTQMQFDVPQSSYLASLHKLIHSHYHFKSRLDDPGHRVPRFSSVLWGVCVPDACTADDIKLGMRKNLDRIFGNTELQVELRVDPSMCQTDGGWVFPTATKIALGVFGAVILSALIATLYDYNVPDQRNEWILAFSLKKNLNAIVETRRSADDIEAVHGIRFMNAILLILSHKSMAIFFVPYSNRTEMVEYLGKPWTVLGRAASLYTDPFIMLSGTLTAYALLRKLNRNKRISLIEEYISRLLRIAPTFAALIAFCTFILPHINHGPLWNVVVSEHAEICKKYWWRNLLFIHNYFGFKEMCLTHTHHVGIDTQLFFLSPFLTWILWKWPKKGAVTLVTIATISTVLRYYVTYSMNLSNYVYFGTSIKQLFDTADYMYILPLHRLTVYIMGIFLGYILRNHRNTVLTENELRFGNALAFCSFIVSFFGAAFMGSIDYVYNPTDAAWYAAFAPIFWCIGFGWIIFRCHIGYKGLMERVFSWPYFAIWTRISYTVYLTQFPIFFYNVGVTRSAEEFGFFKTMLNFKEFSWIVFLSTVLTLLFELPFQNIRNIMFKKTTITNSHGMEVKKVQ